MSAHTHIKSVRKLCGLTQEELAASVAVNLNFFKGVVDAYTSLESLMADAKEILEKCVSAGLSDDEQKEFRQHCNAKCKALA